MFVFEVLSRTMEMESVDVRSGSGSDYRKAFDIICGDLIARRNVYQSFYDRIVRSNVRMALDYATHCEIESTLTDILQFLTEVLGIYEPKLGTPSLESLGRKNVIRELGYSYMCVQRRKIDNEDEVVYAWLINNAVTVCMRIFGRMFGVKGLDGVRHFVSKMTEYNRVESAAVLNLSENFILEIHEDVFPVGPCEENGNVQDMMVFLHALFSNVSLGGDQGDFAQEKFEQLRQDHPRLAATFFPFHQRIRQRGTALTVEDVQEFFINIVGPYLETMGYAYRRLADVCMRRGKFLHYSKYVEMFCGICDRALFRQRDEISYLLSLS